jgi:hypothetical protein
VRWGFSPERGDAKVVSKDALVAYKLKHYTKAVTQMNKNQKVVMAAVIASVITSKYTQ